MKKPNKLQRIKTIENFQVIVFEGETKQSSMCAIAQLDPQKSARPLAFN